MFYNDGVTGKNVLQYVGSMRAMAGAQELEYTQGRARGMRMIELRNGTGIEMKVLPDKAMDVADLHFHGIPMTWVAKTGLTAPWYFENSLKGFLRSWDGGLINTCGLTNAGDECIDGPEVNGIHGRIAHIPAERYSIEEGFDGDAYVIKINALVRECKLLNENLTLRREIVLRSDKSAVTFHDVVTNEGFDTAEYLQMYHINFGYPLISPKATVFTTAKTMEKWNGTENKPDAKFNEFCEPTPGGYNAECFSHIMEGESAVVGIYNPHLEMAAYTRYDPRQMPYMDQWKCLGQGDYAAAFEIGTCLAYGKVLAREKGMVINLRPGEQRRYDFEIGFIKGTGESEAFIAKL